MPKIKGSNHGCRRPLRRGNGAKIVALKKHIAELEGENETLRDVNLLLHKALAPYLEHPDRERVEQMQKAINLAIPILELPGTQYPYEACEQASDILKEALRKDG